MRVIYHYARQRESLQSRVSGFFYSLPPRKQATELFFIPFWVILMRADFYLIIITVVMPGYFAARHLQQVMKN